MFVCAACVCVRLHVSCPRSVAADYIDQPAYSFRQLSGHRPVNVKRAVIGSKGGLKRWMEAQHNI